MKEREQEFSGSNTEIIDLTEIIDGFSGKWIVLSEDKKRVLHSGNNLSDLLREMDDGIVMMVPSSGTIYIPTFI
jgi:hypothetical protein